MLENISVGRSCFLVLVIKKQLIQKKGDCPLFSVPFFPLLGSNKKIAAEIREKLEEKGILAINLLSSPGAGKTSLLERIAERSKPIYKMAVIE
ncbi:unnamed protein product, partial [marine sediment metagenome]